MQSLRDQILKAGLISEKRKRQEDRLARTEDKRIGAKGQAEVAKQRQGDFEANQAERRQQDRERERNRQAREETRAHVLRGQAMVESATVRQGLGGPRRFYFVTRSGQIPFLRINEELARDLEQGRYAIAQIGQGGEQRFAVVARATAERVVEIDPEIIRFWNR